MFRVNKKMVVWIAVLQYIKWWCGLLFDSTYEDVGFDCNQEDDRLDCCFTVNKMVGWIAVLQ